MIIGKVALIAKFVNTLERKKHDQQRRAVMQMVVIATNVSESIARVGGYNSRKKLLNIILMARWYALIAAILI